MRLPSGLPRPLTSQRSLLTSHCEILSGRPEIDRLGRTFVQALENIFAILRYIRVYI
jgi:hypothetical protein